MVAILGGSANNLLTDVEHKRNSLRSFQHEIAGGSKVGKAESERENPVRKGAGKFRERHDEPLSKPAELSVRRT